MAKESGATNPHESTGDLDEVEKVIEQAGCSEKYYKLEVSEIPVDLGSESFPESGLTECRSTAWGRANGTGESAKQVSAHISPSLSAALSRELR